MCVSVCTFLRVNLVAIIGLSNLFSVLYHQCCTLQEEVEVADPYYAYCKLHCNKDVAKSKVWDHVITHTSYNAMIQVET